LISKMGKKNPEKSCYEIAISFRELDKRHILCPSSGEEYQQTPQGVVTVRM
jgi:hypothetical protein